MKDEKAISILSAMAQTTRFAVFRMLMKAGDDGVSAGEIAKKLNVPQNTLSAHLNILNQAGLIKMKRSGRNLFYSISINELNNFLEYLVQDCCDGHPEVCYSGKTPLHTVCN